MVVAESLDDPRTGAVLREHPDEVVVVDPECVTEHFVDSADLQDLVASNQEEVRGIAGPGLRRGKRLEFPRQGQVS